MPESKPEQRAAPRLARAPTASLFARIGLLLYTFLIVYASWYPFTGWHVSGLAPHAFLSTPLPHYWTLFDLAINIVGYIPFGVFFVFALYPALRGATVITLAIIAGSLISGTMEAVQTFLPSRVPSNLDFLTNCAGVCIGAVAGARLSRTFLEESRFLMLRRRWFSEDAGRGLIVLGLWPLAQIYPQAYLFGHGQLTPILSDWLSEWLENWVPTPIDLGAMLRHGAELTVQQYWLSETIITACGLAGALLTLLYMQRERAPKSALLCVLLAAAVTIKSLASALLFAPENAFTWLTPGAQGGILFGLMMLTGLTFAPPIAQRRIATILLTASLVIVNVVPANPYFTATLQTWVQGKFLNFNGAAQFLSLLWPFLALWFLLHPMQRIKRD